MNKKNEYNLYESIGGLSTRFSKILISCISRELERQGFPITSDQWIMLVYIWDQGDQPQGELARRMFRDKTTIARLASTIERKGLIRRRPNRSDSREKILSLTEQGKKTMKKVTTLIHELEEQATAGISLRDLSIFKDVLRRATANLR